MEGATTRRRSSVERERERERDYTSETNEILTGDSECLDCTLPSCDVSTSGHGLASCIY